MPCRLLGGCPAGNERWERRTEFIWGPIGKAGKAGVAGTSGETGVGIGPLCERRLGLEKAAAARGSALV